MLAQVLCLIANLMPCVQPVTSRLETGRLETGRPETRRGLEGGSPDITPPLECSASTHRLDKVGMEGGVPESKQVESGGGDGAWFGRVSMVELCDGFQGKYVGVFYPLVV